MLTRMEWVLVNFFDQKFSGHPVVDHQSSLRFQELSDHLPWWSIDAVLRAQAIEASHRKLQFACRLKYFCRVVANFRRSRCKTITPDQPPADYVQHAKVIFEMFFQRNCSLCKALSSSSLANFCSC